MESQQVVRDTSRMLIIERIEGRMLQLLTRSERRIRTRIWERRLGKMGASGVPLIPTWTRQAELEALYWLASTRRPGALVLEIGSYLGASSCYLALGLTNVAGHLFCVDTWCNETMPNGARDTFPEFERNTRMFTCITAVRKASRDLLPIDVKLPLDLIYLDGDHSYDSTQDDFLRVSPWLAEDGLLIFHDCNSAEHRGVSRVIGEAVAGGEWTIGGVVDSLLWLQRWSQGPAREPPCI